ncbi:MAG: hypothetical protein AB8G86_04160 [Saprospiraceae bacterium]
MFVHHKTNTDLAQCEIIVSNESVQDVLTHFQTLFEIELLQGEIVRGIETTTITFQAAKAKLQALEQIIKAVLGERATLN